MPHIQFNSTVSTVNWNSHTNLWEVSYTDSSGQERIQQSRWLHIAPGYFSYDNPHLPTFPGQENFRGEFFHAQLWPADLPIEGKKFVVIGSGATAVTLVPALAERGASHVTMLQRTPTYLGCLPSTSWSKPVLDALLPEKAADAARRKVNILNDQFQYQSARRLPKVFAGALRALQLRYLPDKKTLDEHFTPPYKPWDQRLCRVPDGDFFVQMHKGLTSVCTDKIDTFTAEGIRTASGEVLEADVIVAATGLRLNAFGGIHITRDGEELSLPEFITYRGMMLGGVENFSFTFGYLNASWTLRADLIARYLVRMFSHMQAHGFDKAIPQNPSNPHVQPFVDYESGYIQRGIGQFPKATDQAPWAYQGNYIIEQKEFLSDDIETGLTFTASTASTAPTTATAATTPSSAVGRDSALIDNEKAFAHSATVNVPVRLADRTGSAGATITSDADHNGEISVRVRIAGKPDAPVLLFLHGIGRSLEDWDKQIPLLEKDWRIISIDHPGFGTTAAWKNSTLDKLAQTALGVLDELGIEQPVHIAGNSMGGTIAMMLAARHPERVRSLALVDSAGFGSSIFPLLRLVAIPRLGELAMKINPPLLLSILEQFIIYKNSAIGAGALFTARRNAENPTRPRAYQQLSHELVGKPGKRPQWHQELIAEVQQVRKDHSIPLWIAWGDKDRILSVSHLKAAEEAFPDATVTVFSRCGHMPQLEQPEKFAHDYQEFLRKQG